jgi:hypothetical protein
LHPDCIDCHHFSIEVATRRSASRRLLLVSVLVASHGSASSPSSGLLARLYGSCYRSIDARSRTSTKTVPVSFLLSPPSRTIISSSLYRLHPLFACGLLSFFSRLDCHLRPCSRFSTAVTRRRSLSCSRFLRDLSLHRENTSQSLRSVSLLRLIV